MPEELEILNQDEEARDITYKAKSFFSNFFKKSINFAKSTAIEAGSFAYKNFKVVDSKAEETGIKQATNRTILKGAEIGITGVKKTAGIVVKSGKYAYQHAEKALDFVKELNDSK